MNKAELSRLVDEGFALDQEIKALEKRLGEIKEVIVTAANGNVVEFEGEGCKATVNYSARMFARVEEGQLPKCRKLAGEYFEKLFCFAPIEKFGDVARALLGGKGQELVTLLTGLPGPRVSFRKS